jgi:D-3-phosphoglycerate dehydrogenase
MKIVKTDGLLTVEAEQMAYLRGLNAEFVEKTLLTEEALIEHCRDADALMVLREPITARVIGELTKLKVIGRFGVGLDAIDVGAATKAGIQVTYVPDANLIEVATHALAMILAMTRHLKTFDRAVRAGRWDAMADGKGIVRPDHQVLGLIGYGQIGRLTAERARAFGYQIIAFDPYMPAEAIAASGAEPVTINALLERADIVSLHIPLTAETRNIISVEALARMKKGAFLVNVSRGGLVDEAALAAAIRNGHIAGAAIDTFEHEPPASDNPLLSLGQVILSPHAAHYSVQSYADVRNKVFADVAAVLLGKKPRYPVNQV